MRLSNQAIPRILRIRARFPGFPDSLRRPNNQAPLKIHRSPNNQDNRHSQGNRGNPDSQSPGSLPCNFRPASTLPN
jgi:hypothetical protein